MIDKKRTSTYSSRDNLALLQNWDGIERRSEERRALISASLGEMDEPARKTSPLLVKYAPVISVVLAFITTVGSFGATLYARITKLESNQITITEKIEFVKRDIEDVKLLIKEGDRSKAQLQNQINSLEESFVQLYSSKTKK